MVINKLNAKFFFKLFLCFVFIFTAACATSPGGSAHKSRTKKNYSQRTKSSHIADRARENTKRRGGNWSLTSQKVQEVKPFVEKASLQYDIPRNLIYGVIWVESRFNPEAVSPVGARGLMQLMPRTADYLAECIKWNGRHRSHDPEFNINAGTYYVSKLIDMFDGDVDKALAAYNAGPGKVKRWLAGSGLPKASIEYATMVQTARTFFGKTDINYKDTGKSETNVISDDSLDRLGLSILIAGLENKQFGLDRIDSAKPFD